MKKRGKIKYFQTASGRIIFPVTRAEAVLVKKGGDTYTLDKILTELRTDLDDINRVTEAEIKIIVDSHWKQ